MGLSDNYQTIKESISSISTSLTGKEVSSVTKLEEVADEIRKIELSKGGEYTVIVDCTSSYLNMSSSGAGATIIFAIHENTSSGNEILNINETKSYPVSNTYEYTFTTDAETIYIDIFGSYLFVPTEPSKTLVDSATLTDLKKHHKIRIKLDPANHSIKYDD